MNIANAIVLGSAAYAAIGALFAIAFVTRGAGAIDAVAAHAPWGFRLVILPGSAALWPVLMLRWLRARGRTPARAEHRDTHTLERHS